MLIGTPLKLNFSLNLFSIKRVYDSPIYCGKLQKKAKATDLEGNCAAYLILIYFPFVAGGGFCCKMGKIKSFNSDVLILRCIFSLTCNAVSNALLILCFVRALTNSIGTSVNGLIDSWITSFACL